MDLSIPDADQLGRKGLGDSALRVEDLSLLTGNGRYADDLPPPKGIHDIAFLRSPHAHARIRSIDTSKTLLIDGVIVVITGDTLASSTKPFITGVMSPIQQFALAVENARYFGEPVCIVVAKDRYVAEDVLDDIYGDYETLPAIVDPEAWEARAYTLRQRTGVHRRKSARLIDKGWDQAFVCLSRQPMGKWIQ